MKPRKPTPGSPYTEHGILPKRQAYAPPDLDKADVVAIQAVAAGTANGDQQRRAMRFIVDGLCARYDWGFRPEGDRETCVVLGRQFVGCQLTYLINTPVGVAAKKGVSDDGRSTESGR